jgi:hypothetical protein
VRPAPWRLCSGRFRDDTARLATWREFAVATAITAAFGALVALRIGLTTTERQEVVDRVLRLVGLRSAARSTGAA